VIRFVTGDVKALERAFRGVRERAMPRAVAVMLNNQAFGARRSWLASMDSEFIIRNKWTKGSVRIVKAKRARNLANMVSIVGSVAPYMADAELGETHRPQGKHGVAMPTSAGAGMAQGAKPRTKAVRKRLRSIPVQTRADVNLGRSKSAYRRGVQTMIAIRQARKSGKKHAYLELKSGAKGVFKVMGTKRKPSLRMLWDISRGSVRQPPTPTMQMGVDAYFSAKSRGFARTFGRSLRWGKRSR